MGDGRETQRMCPFLEEPLAPLDHRAPRRRQILGDIGVDAHLMGFTPR
jgi:hypothetical protein